jgi:hypothetical protein
MLGQAGEALQVHSGAERNDKLVVVQVDRDALRALDDDDLLLGKVDAHDFSLAHLNPPQQLTQRHNGVGGMDGRCGHLGEQRLEHEIVVGVDELDVELAAAEPCECLGSEHAAEAAADHQHLFLRHKLVHCRLLATEYLIRCCSASSHALARH